MQKHITRLESEGKSLKYLNKRCKDKHGKTFVHSAVAHNQVAILKLLLDHKAGKVQHLKLQPFTVCVKQIKAAQSKESLLVSYPRDHSQKVTLFIRSVHILQRNSTKTVNSVVIFTN